MTHSESQAVQDQTDPDLQVVYENCDHRMISIKTSSPMVPWIERCQDCGLIDSHALEQTGHQIIKVSLSERAGRIAVTAESEPFAFTQNSFDDLDLQEVLGQALGAASVCWVGGTGSLEFDGTRAKAIYEALMREVSRFQRLALEDAATRAVDYIYRPGSPFKSESFCIELRRAIEGGQSDGTDRVKAWSDLAYEFYGLACNVGQGDLKTQTDEWRECFDRLNKQFHELLKLLP